MGRDYRCVDADSRIHVSDRGRFGFSHIDAEEQGVEALGYVVINRVLGEVLQDALSGTEPVTYFVRRVSTISMRTRADDRHDRA